MTLIIQKPTGAKLNLRKTWQPMDPDAAAYITAVETADNQALEERVKIAIDNFVLGCKADGIWSAIKASCILAGARTLNGALVPLAGTAPTSFNFVSGDYNRKTGLVGDGSTKYLDTNRAGNADPQNSHHACVYATTANTGTKWYLGSENNATGATNLFSVSGSFAEARSRNTSSGSPNMAQATGFIGIARSISSAWTMRIAQRVSSYTQSSQTPTSANYGVFLSLGYSPAGAHGDGRYAFYSIGESLNLALLDARVTDLINAFGAAIP